MPEGPPTRAPELVEIARGLLISTEAAIEAYAAARRIAGADHERALLDRKLAALGARPAAGER